MSTTLEDEVVIASFKPILNNGLMQKENPFETKVVENPEERALLFRLRQAATEELSRHNLSQTAWDAAMERANHNDIRARSFYVDYRVEELRDQDAKVGKAKQDEVTKERREKSKYENTVFLLLLVACLVIAIIFGKLL
jgi:hypothetical protein